MEHLRVLQNVVAVNDELAGDENKQAGGGGGSGLGVEGGDLMLHCGEWQALKSVTTLFCSAETMRCSLTSKTE